jgi:UDP-glucose 4-epimerase
MNIIVTGAAGFIGSHLCEELIKDGHQVIGIDNLSNGQLKNMNSFINSTNFVFYQEDINDINKIVTSIKIDAFFHLAALADIVPSIENPMTYHNSNVTGTIATLEFCRHNKIKRYFYTASSSCYGLPNTYPTNENQIIDCQYPYALTKYLGEQYVFAYSKYYDLEVTSLRLFNVYGPRSRTNGTYGAVFGVFLAQKINNKPYTIVGDGSQTRDFTYVTDVVSAFVTCFKNSNSVGKIYNVGSGNTYSINKLVEILEGEIVHIPKRPGEPDKTFANIDKIKTELNWIPEISFEEGVKNMLLNIDYWKDAPIWEADSIKDATKVWFKYLK